MKQALLIFVLMFIESKGFGQPKHGFVDYDKVVLALPEYQVKQSQLKVLSAQFDDSLKVMGIEYQHFLLNGISHNAFDTTGLAHVERTVRSMETRIEDYQSLAIAQLTRFEVDAEATFKDVIVKAMSRFCVNNNIISVVDKDKILYCLDCIDFTAEFIEFMKKNN
jgi:Skp family chaperone for outer membrane proteins